MRITLPLTACVLAASAIAQTVVYPNAAPRATSVVIAGSDVGAPSLRYWGGSASDGTRLFNFGGRGVDATGTALSTYFNGLDAYNPATNAWSNLSAEANPLAPSSRFRAAMAYDPTFNRLVIFGGSAAPGLASSDGYSFDLGTNTWSQIPNPTPGVTGPSDRFDARIAFDATTGMMLLFGGDGPASSTADRLNDTWLLAGSVWIQLSPSNSPSARALFAMAARSAPYSDIVLIGGQDTNSVNLNDTWRWDGGTQNWAQITPINSTLPVTWASGSDAIYDSVRQVVTILGGPGTNVAPSHTTAAGSWTSEYDCVLNEWRAYGPSTTSQTASDPVIGQVQRMAVAFVNGKTYHWAGQNVPTVGDANLPFVKEYQASPIASSVAMGAGCNSSTGPLTLTADNAPWTGRTWSLTGSGFPAGSLGFAAIGFGTQSLPISSVHAAGGAGCNVLVSLDSTLLTLPVAGQTSFTLALPMNPAFAGIVLNVQKLCIEVGGGGQITRISSTGAIAGTIGAL